MFGKLLSPRGRDTQISAEVELQERKSIWTVFRDAVQGLLPSREQPLSDEEKKAILEILEQRSAEMDAGKQKTADEIDEMMKPLFDDWREAARREREGPTPRR